MRKVTIFLLVLTFFIWLAIARYWTGTGEVKPSLLAPALNSAIPVEKPVPTQIIPSLVASPSAVQPTATVSGTEIKY